LSSDAHNDATGGPFFDDLEVGLRITDAPPLTLTDANAAIHQAIVGDRLRLSLDSSLAAEVIGRGGTLAHPALVWDVAIGQSTLITRRVVANLFYRGLVFRRAPAIGDTLRTVTEVVALRENSRRPERPPTGLAVLRVLTVDQERRPVLNFLRCAMLPLSSSDVFTGHGDDLDSVEIEITSEDAGAAASGWRLDAFREATQGPHFTDVIEGDTWNLESGDVVSSAPELARLTLNVASVHHDGRHTGKRLVYGGHTVGIATAQLTKALPGLVTILAWHSCDHTGPVLEGDTLTSRVLLEQKEPLPAGGGLVHLRSRAFAHRGGEPVPVLDWRLVGLMA
jgi:acyl dehydratase